MPSLKVPTVHTHEKEDTTKLGIWLAGITQACSAGCCSFFGSGFLFRCGISKSLILIQIGKESFPKVLFQNNIHLYSFLPSTCFKVNKQWELYWLCVHPWTMLIVAESISPVFMSVLQCYWMSLLLHSSTCFPVFLFITKTCQTPDVALLITNIGNPLISFHYPEVFGLSCLLP